MNQTTPRTPNAVWKKFLMAGLVAIPLCFFTACNRNTSPDSTVTFGKVVTASGVDSGNAPTALADTFSPQQKTIYVVAEAKEVAPGTHLSANWYRDGQAVQVSNEVIASQGYHDTNIEFHMSPGADGWVPGSYKVQILVNGKPGPETSFSIK